MLSASPTQLDPIPDSVAVASNENTMATVITVYYAHQVAKQRDAAGLMRILPLLSGCDVDTVYSDTSLHMLVSYLAVMPDSFSNQHFCQIILQQFFMVCWPTMLPSYLWATFLLIYYVSLVNY